MNEYLLAIIGLLALFIVGSIFYRFAANESVKANKIVLDPMRFVVAGVGMYIIALSFIYLFDHLTLGSLTGVGKGATLGLFLGIVFWGLPFFADADYLKGDSRSKWVVFFNWVVGLLALGVVVGLLR